MGMLLIASRATSLGHGIMRRYEKYDIYFFIFDAFRYFITTMICEEIPRDKYFSAQFNFHVNVI